MREKWIWGAALAALGCAWAGGTALSQEGDAAMEAWMKACTPGEKHERLGALVGTWDTVTRIWMAPGQPPSEDTGEAEFTWLFPGRWIQQRTKGTMMGMPHEGFGVLGYDNFKQKYVGSWTDNMTTALLTFQGSFDKQGDNLVMWGPMDEPMTGEHDKTVKYVTRFRGPDELLFEIHDMVIGEGPEAKVIEISYKRRKQ